MELTSNSTGMAAGLAVFTDKHAREHCLVVVKGTFDADVHGTLRLSSRQEPLIYVDEHEGDPAVTAIRRESEFSPPKPHAEVLVHGSAFTPGGTPADRVDVCLEIDGRRKEAIVFGERRWVDTGAGLAMSHPARFTEMPLTYGRAFGGNDDSDPAAVLWEPRNLVGVGFNPRRRASEVADRALPNIEDPTQLIRSPRDAPGPVGFGVLGRSWRQRVRFAGTYDQRWLDEVCPFLPADFDARYFMSSAHDQWAPLFEGGERIRCLHMAPRPVVEYVLPRMAVPVRFDHADELLEARARLDTVIVEPHLGRAILLWRASAPLGKRLSALRSVSVGQSAAQPAAYRLRHGKPHFPSLGQAVQWLIEMRGRL